MENVFQVLTVRDVEFQDDKKNDVKGMQLWLLGETQEREWNGHEVLKIWISDGHRLEPVVASLKHGDQISVTFDRRGKPSSIEVI